MGNHLTVRGTATVGEKKKITLLFSQACNLTSVRSFQSMYMPCIPWNPQAFGTGRGAAWSSRRCPWQGCWNERIFKVPLNPKRSVLLWMLWSLLHLHFHRRAQSSVHVWAKTGGCCCPHPSWIFKRFDKVSSLIKRSDVTATSAGYPVTHKAHLCFGKHS